MLDRDVGVDFRTIGRGAGAEGPPDSDVLVVFLENVVVHRVDV